jgi:hypothetical protein
MQQNFKLVAALILDFSSYHHQYFNIVKKIFFFGAVCTSHISQAKIPVHIQPPGFTCKNLCTF